CTDIHHNSDLLAAGTCAAPGRTSLSRTPASATNLINVIPGLLLATGLTVECHRECSWTGPSSRPDHSGKENSVMGTSLRRARRQVKAQQTYGACVCPGPLVKYQV